MNYRVECLTPTLAGDGSALSPIDYMVWKDQVNVLNQRRIFTLLAKGPRLDSYLTQIKKDEKLEFATWGGFAQNYAERRIAFEDPVYAGYWQKLRAEYCHIPTFARATGGPILPGSVIRGALRTAVVASRANHQTLAAVEAAFEGDRPPRRPGETAEHHALGRSTHDPMKAFAIGDSDPVDLGVFQIHMLRTATLVEAKGASPGVAKYGLGWRMAPRGSVESRRIEDSTAAFAEMAVPGAVFQGRWTERAFYANPEIARTLGFRLTLRKLVEAANESAEILLNAHAGFASFTGLAPLAATIEQLRERLAGARQSGDACLLNIGWAAGLLAKTAFPNPEEEGYRNVLAHSPHYSRAAKSGFPFPKTRRIVFRNNQPATLAGWVLLEVG
jgi:CRISPR-associated protein Csm5